ncbi:MAG: hypothetical protein ACLF0G_07920 [Candidatus Brocadiia bacterium]
MARLPGRASRRVGTPRARRTDPRAYPDGNLWFDSFQAAGVDPETCVLLSGSKPRGTATDGTAPGADVDAVLKATASVREVRP